MPTKEPCLLSKACTVLVLLGGLNWGLVGLGGFLSRDMNAIELVLGKWPGAVWTVYLLVGLATILMSLDACCERK